jgi:hypothetical protein
MKKTTNRKKSPKKQSKTQSRRTRLERATAAYYASLSGEALREEQELERAIGSASSRVDFDN